MTNKQKLYSIVLVSAAVILTLVNIAGATPFAYITNGESNNVSVIDTTTNNVIATVNGLNYPFGVAVSPDGTKVYVTNSDDTTVSVINTTTNNVIATVSTGIRPLGIAVTPDGKKVYVANEYEQTVSVIDTVTNNVIATVHAGGGPLGVAVSPNGTRAYVTNAFTNAVIVIDTATNTDIATVNVGNNPTGVAVTPDGKKVYVANTGSTSSNTISVIDTATNTVTATVNVGSLPTAFGQFIGKSIPTIYWNSPANITYGTALTGTQLDATASVNGNFVYNPPSGTVLNIGTHTLNTNFTPTDTANYTTASKSISITVTKITPIITWSNPANITYGTALTSTQLDATASVNGNFVYNPPSGTVLSAGTHALTATFTPADNVNYTTVSANVLINITQVTPTITWSNPADIVYGTPLSTTQLDATASVNGNFVYNPPSGTVLSIGTHTLNTNFTPTDTANYTTALKSILINVTKATPTVTWTAKYGTSLSTTQLDASASIPGNFSYSQASGIALSAGQQTLTATFTPTDTADYNTVSASVLINIVQVTPTITWSNPADIVYGTPLSSTQLNATSSVPGTLVYNPPTGTILDEGTQTLNAFFTPTDSIDYTTASAGVSINVIHEHQNHGNDVGSKYGGYGGAVVPVPVAPPVPMMSSSPMYGSVPDGYANGPNGYGSEPNMYTSGPFTTEIQNSESNVHKTKAHLSKHKHKHEHKHHTTKHHKTGKKALSVKVDKR
jgi:YVTN family beta-propeller protein